MESEAGVVILVFVVLSLLVGALIKTFSNLLKSPYSVILLILGLTVGLLSRSEIGLSHVPLLNASLLTLSDVDPHLILMLFLPTLIFESAFGMDAHLFKRMFSQITILAVPGLLLTTGLTSVLAYYAFPWNWSWTVCLLFGALISATDPVAVVSLLKEVSSSKRLETLLEGESLLNDGTAIVLFTLFYGLLAFSGHAQTNLFEVGVEFILVVILGLLIGAAVGGLVLGWVGRVFNQPVVEITLTISAAYIAYFIAERLFHVSGVVAVVALGLMLASFGRTRISPEVADFLHHFWHMMAHIANTIIFVLVGIIIATRIRLDVVDWWWSLAVLYVGIQVVRGISIWFFMPVLKRFGVGINRAKGIVLAWGGLRGAVSLALALIINQDVSLGGELGDQILFLTAGIVALTIVINSTSMTWLLSKVGLNQISPAKQLTIDKARYSIKLRILSDLDKLQRNELLRRANWKALRIPFENIKQPKECDINSDVDTNQLRVAFLRRLLETERNFYWAQYKHGSLTGQSVAQLVNAVELALDGEPKLSPREALFKFWKTPPHIRFFNRIPIINHFVVSFSFNRLALSYDTARGFYQAQNEVIKHIHNLAPSVQDAQEALADIEANKQQTRVHIEGLREYFPDLSYSLETHTAHRLVLNMERSHLLALVDEGVLDESEAKKMVNEVEFKLASLKQEQHHVSSRDIAKQLREMEWTAGFKTTSFMAMGKIAQRQIINEDELIYSQYHHASAIALLVHGKISLVNLEKEQVVESGSLIGCEAFITDTYKFNAKAITPSELIWFDLHKLKAVASKDKQLEKILVNALH